MPAATENRQPTPLSPLKHLVVRHSVAAFLIMLYAIAWTVFLPVVVAPAFVLQHMPILLMDAGVGLTSLIIVGALVIVAVFFRVVVMWLYNGSGRSVLVVALFHSAYNSAWGTGDQMFTGELIAGPAVTLIPIGVVAVVVAAFTKGRLSYEPERVSQRAATARS
jgi:hypothetical protein